MLTQPLSLNSTDTLPYFLHASDVDDDIFSEDMKTDSLNFQANTLSPTHSHTHSQLESSTTVPQENIIKV